MKFMEQLQFTAPTVQVPPYETDGGDDFEPKKWGGHPRNGASLRPLYREIQTTSGLTCQSHEGTKSLGKTGERSSMFPHKKGG